ncbi:hypothetical protein [Myxococcus qinghaiensis]|uniref:hypothetical protein n=1 Tax=Myxococcus qinghaiensis TaxID=2906758 RepID=UPI0020A71373|nr:hypothetical protein [Myxococcus qinghaiensis]MCP3168700.1 hypothetical protein [Myxococcus qinghaiensis]
MFQNRRRQVLTGVVLGTALVLGGCSSSRSASKQQVDESWMARVPESQLGDVRNAQAERLKAQDEVKRAEVAVKDAERAAQVAERNEEAAKLSTEANKTAVEAAQATGRASNISQAQAELKTMETRQAAAHAQLLWRQRAIETQKARRDLRQRELELADARLRQTELVALRNSDDVRAKELSEAEFTSAVANAQRNTEEAQRQVDERLRVERQARSDWEKLNGEARGYGGSGNSDEE